MEAGRFRIRCPSCGAEGKARLETLDRRVRCKHCDHKFLAVPVEKAGPAGATTSARPPGDRKLRASSSKPSRESLRLRVEALERDVREIRRGLAGPVPRYPEPEPAPPSAPPGPEVDDLRSQLDRALEAAREAESRQVAQKVADAEKIDELRRELAALREKLDRAEVAAAEPAGSAFEPSAERPIPDNSRSWP